MDYNPGNGNVQLGIYTACWNNLWMKWTVWGRLLEIFPEECHGLLWPPCTINEAMRKPFGSGMLIPATQAKIKCGILMESWWRPTMMTFASTTTLGQGKRLWQRFRSFWVGPCIAGGLNRFGYKVKRLYLRLLASDVQGLHASLPHGCQSALVFWWQPLEVQTGQQMCLARSKQIWPRVLCYDQCSTWCAGPISNPKSNLKDARCREMGFRLAFVRDLRTVTHCCGWKWNEDVAGFVWFRGCVRFGFPSSFQEHLCWELPWKQYSALHLETGTAWHCSLAVGFGIGRFCIGFCQRDLLSAKVLHIASPRIAVVNATVHPWDFQDHEKNLCWTADSSGEFFVISFRSNSKIP